MSPSPQEHLLSPPVEPGIVPVELKDDDIVISGLSGLFPACNNVKEFSEKLYQHVNLITEKGMRWNSENFEVTQHLGKVPNLDRFDAQFFKVHHNSAKLTEAMTRKLLEQSYQAIFDAGYSANEFNGKKLGVFMGIAFTESEKNLLDRCSTGIGLIGCNRAMFSNRISYWLNATGPSMSIDASCSSSMVCIEKACEALRRGDCEWAIVGGCNSHLNPESIIHYKRMFGLNRDGKTKCFDKNADGPSLAECVSVVFLQKAGDAKRVYATICDVKTQFGTMETNHYDRYGPQRNSSYLSTFYDEFYQNLKIVPADVEYVEAFGSAYSEADKNELEAIQEIFCKNRSNSLLVGSVMSNMGFSYAATTMAALTKVCLAYQTGKIAANLHYVTPHDDIPAISDGRIQVVTDNKPFGRSYAAINSLALTGVNGHLLLKGHYKPKDVFCYKSQIPYLVTASGRQESGVQMIFEDLKSHSVDPEVIALIHAVHKNHISQHLARGFVILHNDVNKTSVCLKERVDYYDDAKRPLWFVYSGMGSQWNGMGKDLMRIPTFAAAIQRCHKVLEPKGVDLLHILSSSDKTIYENILNSFVGIAAVQIGLTDVLSSIGLLPDNIIGHSVGELGCAYADGCLTAEEMILAAYYRGYVSLNTPLIKGAMAAVGLGWQQLQSLCPPEIQIACHNSAESSTISGPVDIMRNFVAQLTAQKIFAKEVNSSNIAYHSRYIKDAGPGLLKYLKTVIKDPKPRSKRWLSTSVPREKWDEPAAQICSAEYHTNNLLSPVLFEETSQEIPAHAVLVEVAPHGLLQAILKRALPDTCTNIALTRRGHLNNAQYLLEAVGELYMSGFNPDLSILYPKVDFPVSTETRSLSHLIEWVHDEEWCFPALRLAKKFYAATYETTLSTYDNEFSFLRGHIIDGETIFPFAAALVFVWDTLAMSVGMPRKELSVKFHEIHFHTQPLICEQQTFKIGVQLHRGNGLFEVINENTLIASGYIEPANEVTNIYPATEDRQIKMEEMIFNSNDIYRILFNRGHGYRGEFRSLQKGNADMSHAIVEWKNNWVTLIDAAIQMNVLKTEGDMTQQPRFIQQINIDIKQHKFAVQTSPHGTSSLEAYNTKDQNITRCGGVVLRHVLFTNIPALERSKIGLKRLKFVPYNQLEIVDVSTALYTILQILEDNAGDSITVLNISESEDCSFLGNAFSTLLHELSTMKVKMIKINYQDILKAKKKIQSSDIVLVDELITTNNSIKETLANAIPPETFILILEESTVFQSMYKVVASIATPHGRLVLARWRPKAVADRPQVISVTSSKDISLLQSARNSMSANSALCILTQYPPMTELKDLVKQWRNEPENYSVYMAMVTTSENVQPKELPVFELAYNVLHNGTWGGYYFTRGGQVKGKINDVTLRSANIGNLDSLQWTEATGISSSNNIIVSVHYAGLSSYDAVKAIVDVKSTPNDLMGPRYGMDFSGITMTGDRVMGIVREAAASSKVSAEPSLLWPVPEHWTLEDAATVPLAYAHAFYLLGVKCGLYRGMSVLVHGAAGGLGQAVITVALANQCQVFAAVSDIKKKQLLRKLFPDLPAGNIGNSRDVSFGDMVLTETKGKGCDIVISCGKGDLKNTSLSCCASWGTTLDTQTVHSKDAYVYKMFNMTKSRSYIATDFTSVFEPDNHTERNQLQIMVSEGIARGFVRPLSRVTYDARDAGKAMRLIVKSQHIGRVLLRMHHKALIATKRLTVQTCSSHLVISASKDKTVAIGIVDLLIKRGAATIGLHSLQKNESNDTFMTFKEKYWQNLGAKVESTFGTLNAEIAEFITKSNTNLGPVHSIFVVMEETEKDTASFLENIDNTVRQSCSSIRIFTVICNNANIGRDICINRAVDGLPGLMLQIPALDKFNELNKTKDDEISREKDALLMRNIMPILENALCSTEPVVVLYNTDPQESLPHKLCQIASESFLFRDLLTTVTTNIATEDLNDSTTIGELGLKNEQIQEILKSLRKYHVLLPEQVLYNMTFVTFLELMNKVEQIKPRVPIGLERLLSNINPDELVSATDIIFMNTLAEKSQIVNHRPEDTILFMVPGIEGHSVKFESLCERLKLPAAVLQPGVDHINETVPEMANRLVKIILKRFGPKQKFCLLGYSFGVLVVLEMAAILEDYGFKGVIFCVDASPDTFAVAIESWLRDANITHASQLQDEIVQHLYKLISGSISNKLNSQLQEATTWNEKVEAGMRALRNKVPHSNQYVRRVIETTYARITEAQRYKSLRTVPLRSQIVLMRSQSYPHTSPDLCLERYSEQKPHVYELSEDHANVLNDLRCANIVNKYLDKQTLHKFYKKNLCNTYFNVKTLREILRGE